MANREKTVSENVSGAFFVDATCIDCGTCRHVAPKSFAEAAENSFVFHQPENDAEVTAALRALVSCPTGSIGTDTRVYKPNTVMADFPLPLDEGLYYCGYTSASSYGASSYFLLHPEGNWLIDSPKWMPRLAERFEAMGGIRWIFLTHRDDVADAAAYAMHFGAKRMIHAADQRAMPDAEMILDITEPQQYSPAFKLIPVPGHSPGSWCLLYQNRYLFSGDHVWWEPNGKKLTNPNYIYWDRAKMLASNHALLSYQFEWILPGHGAPVHLDRETMQQAVQMLCQNTKAL
ncbi:MAG: ferredoxin [Cyanobacteria bacterium]|nr:ferredoxin [Cyanobacteriota bacterium]